MADSNRERDLERLVNAIGKGKTDEELMREFHLSYSALKSALDDIRRMGLGARFHVAGRRRDSFSIRQRMVSRLDFIIRSSLQVQFLFIVCLAVALSVAGAILISLGSSWDQFPGNLWWSFLRVSDSGYLGESKTLWERVVGVLITLGGLVLFGLVLSVLSTAFNRRWEQLEKGKTRVLVRDHTIILGWDPEIFKIIDKLLDDPGIRREAIVVMANESAAEMTESVTTWCRSPRKHRVLCRTGNSDRISDLLNVRLPFSEEIIVLSTESTADARKQDSNAITTLCACIKAFEETSAQRWRTSRREARKAHLALTATDREVAKVLRHLERENQYLEIHIAEPDDFISRLLALSAIMPGIHLVMEELISSEGNTVYIRPLSRMIGNVHMSFRDLYLKWYNILPVGYVRHGDPYGSAIVNPSDDATLLGPEDSLAFIARDPHAVPEECRHSPDEKLHAVGASSDKPVISPRRVLLLGENGKARNILRSLAEWLPEGSLVVHTCEGGLEGKHAGDTPAHLEYRPLDGSSSSRLQIIRETIGHSGVPFHAAILVPDDEDPESSDAQVLLDTVAIRKTEEDRDNADGSMNTHGHRTMILGELFSAQHYRLGSIAGLDVGLVTSDLICDYLFHAVEDPRGIRVLRNFLKTEGSDPVLVPAKDIVSFGAHWLPMFSSVMNAARSKRIGDLQVLPIGYFRRGEAFINPPRETKIESTDLIICLADMFQKRQRRQRSKSSA